MASWEGAISEVTVGEDAPALLFPSVVLLEAVVSVIGVLSANTDIGKANEVTITILTNMAVIRCIPVVIAFLYIIGSPLCHW